MCRAPRCRGLARLANLEHRSATAAAVGEAPTNFHFTRRLMAVGDRGEHLEIVGIVARDIHGLGVIAVLEADDGQLDQPRPEVRREPHPLNPEREGFALGDGEDANGA